MTAGARCDSMKPSTLLLLAAFGLASGASISLAQEVSQQKVESSVPATPANEATNPSSDKIKNTDTPKAPALLNTSGVAKKPGEAAPPRLSGGVAEIVRMVEGGVEPSVMEAYIQNTNIPFYPSAAEIVYLHELGVSSQIITALIRRGGEVRAQQAQVSKDLQQQIAQQQQQAAANANNYNQAAAAPVTYVRQPASYNYYVNSYPSYSYAYASYPYAYSYYVPFYSSYSYYYRPYRSFYYPVSYNRYCYPSSSRFVSYPRHSINAGISFRHSSPIRSSIHASVGHRSRPVRHGR
jgi:hypothetical protein